MSFTGCAGIWYRAGSSPPKEEEVEIMGEFVGYVMWGLVGVSAILMTFQILSYYRKHRK
jgi:hypothetical protein